MSDESYDSNYFDDGNYEEDYNYMSDEEQKIDLTKDIYLACENNLYSKQTCEDIVDTYKQVIRSVAFENGISLGRAFLILQAHDYEQSKCDNIPSKLIDTIFYKESKELVQMKDTKQCLLCFEDLNENTKYSLECHHNFCKNECFKEYMKACLYEGSSILYKTCPLDGCKERIGINEASEFFKNSKEINLYNKFLLNDILQHSKLIIQCPHTDCNQVLDFGNNKHIQGKQLNLKCSCEKGYFCSSCKEDAHLPCSCDMFRNWMELLQGKNSEDMNCLWLKLHTKPCPKCKVLIEKNQGCMHMNCKNCNFHFCWLCLGEYVNHNDFYSCNKYKKEEGNPLSNEEEKLKKYDFFSERYKDHLGAARYSQIEANQHIQQLIKAMNSTDIKVEDRPKEQEFYIHAYDILIEAKKCIAYTYPIGYYIEEFKRQYFEFLQGELEKNLNPFEELLSQTDFEYKFNKDSYYQPFYEYKQKVLDSTTKIKSYLCKMMKDLGDELPELDIKKLKSKSKRFSKIERQLSKKLQNEVKAKSKNSISNIEDDSMNCDDCKINPVQNDYGLCNNCLNSRYQN